MFHGVYTADYPRARLSSLDCLHIAHTGQGLVPRSPARVCVRATLGAEISARISLQICRAILGGILAVASLQPTVLHVRVQT